MERRVHIAVTLAAWMLASAVRAAEGEQSNLFAGDIGNVVWTLVIFVAVILVLGVNGVGKTTFIAKLAHRLARQGKSVILAAADTFRAGASEQLRAWASRDRPAGRHCRRAGPESRSTGPRSWTAPAALRGIR